MSETKLLKDLCIEKAYGIYGIPASAEPFDENKTRYLRISDISDNGDLLDDKKKSVSAENLNKYLLNEGDLVVARTGNSTGRTYYHEEKNGHLAFAGFLIKYSLDSKKVNPKYLKYFTVSKQYKQWVQNLSVGSTRGNINAQTFASCPIFLPSRDQQNLLVKNLETLDAKIEVNNKINRELEGMAKLLYDYWFVQFDFPNAEGKPYKRSGGKMVFSQAMNREVPKGWDVEKLGDRFKIDLGGTPSTKNNEFWKNGNIPWLNSGEIANFPIIDSELKITKSAVENSATTILPKGTVLLSITRHLRPSILAIDACANQSVVGIFETEEIKSNYLYPYLRNEIPRLMGLRTGAQQPHINKGIVKDSPIIIPPSELMISYNNLTEPIYSKIINSSFENQQLAKQRDWLLPMLMNGQVRVE